MKIEIQVYYVVCLYLEEDSVKKYIYITMIVIDIYVLRMVFVVAICFGLFSCSMRDSKSDILIRDNWEEKVDSSTAENVYTAATLDEYKAVYDLQSYLTDADSLHIETIDFDCAILIYPTEEQIERMKKGYGEEDFYIVADDNNWYQEMANGIIDSLGVKRIIASGKYLRLKGESKTWTLNIRSDNLPSWNLVFFKKSKEPQVVSTAGLSVEATRDFFEIPEQ